MIPDFPDIKTKVIESWNNYLVRKHNAELGFWSTVPSRAHHEGDEWIIVRADGTSSRTEYKEVSSTVSIDARDYANLGPQEVKAILDGVAEDMAGKMSQDLFQVLNESLQSIDASGRNLSRELFLEMLETIWIDFDRAGNPIFPTLVMHPSLLESVKDDMESWEKDKDFVAKQKAVIEKKREQWRDRESSRKLVD